MRVNWTELKKFVDDRGLSIQWVDANDKYYLKAYDANFSLSLAINKDGNPDQTDFENNYKANGNKLLDKKSPTSQRHEVAIYQPEGTFKAHVTHNFNDKTTWYTMSQRVIGEALNLETGKTYTSVNPNWIDLVHGKHTREDDIAATYVEKVYDNGTELISETQYTVNYKEGKVVLDASYSPTGPITADYSYATTSEFILKPNVGKVLKIEHTELDFSIDTIMKSTHFQIWAYNPADLPNKVMVAQTTYKNELDILKVANAITHIAKWGSLTQDVKRAEFEYSRTIDLKDSQGAEMRVRIKDDAEFIGEWSTATLYTSEEDE